LAAAGRLAALRAGFFAADFAAGFAAGAAGALFVAMLRSFVTRNCRSSIRLPIRVARQASGFDVHGGRLASCAC
jgi:hypothetical protein